MNFYHILSRLVTPYHTLSPGLDRKPFSFGNFKISSQAPDFLSHLITPCHSLSHLITPYHTLSPGLDRKPFSFGKLKISSQAPDFLSHLIMPCHALPLHITLYPLGWTENHFHLATLKLVPRPLIFYHILSCLVTPYHTLSHLIPWVGQKTIFIWQL